MLSREYVEKLEHAERELMKLYWQLKEDMQDKDAAEVDKILAAIWRLKNKRR